MLQNCQTNADCNAQQNCKVCPFGYSLLVVNTSQTCVECNTNSNCARCRPDNTTTCISCKKGDYLNSQKVCVACTDGCARCQDANTCFACSKGYVSNLPASTVSSSTSQTIAAKPITCLQCESPCATCTSSQTTCTSCITNYTIKGTTCISRFKVTINAVFNVNASNFVSNFYSLLRTVSDTVNQDINTIAVLSIVYGSAAVQMDVSTPTADNSAQTQNISSLFSSGNVGSMQLSSSSVTTTGTNSTSNSNSDDSSSDDTTLIVAIVVPIVVVRNEYVM